MNAHTGLSYMHMYTMKHTFMCITLITGSGSVVRAKLIKSTKTADPVHKAKTKNMAYTMQCIHAIIA